MEKVVVFPGSFDPITIGHVDIIERASLLFDKVVVAAGQNSKKTYLFTHEERVHFIKTTFVDNPKVQAGAFSGLTVNYCKSIGVNFLIRGVRSTADFDFEKTIAQLNQSLNSEIDTVLLICKPELSHISSSIVREILVNKGNVAQFVPAAILPFMEEKVASL